MSQRTYTEAVCDRCSTTTRTEGIEHRPPDWAAILTIGVPANPAGTEFLLCQPCLASFNAFLTEGEDRPASPAVRRRTPGSERMSELAKKAMQGRPRDAKGRLLPRTAGGPPAILNLLRTGPASSPDLATASGMPARTVLHYLRKLFDSGLVGFDPDRGWVLPDQPNLSEPAPSPDPAPDPFWARPRPPAPAPSEAAEPTRFCPSKRYQASIGLYARCARPAGHAGRHRHLRVILDHA